MVKDLRKKILHRTGMLLTILVSTTFGIFSFQSEISKMEFEFFLISFFIIFGMFIRALQTWCTNPKEPDNGPKNEKTELKGFFFTGAVMSILFLIAPLLIILHNVLWVINILFLELGYAFIGLVLEVLIIVLKE